MKTIRITATDFNIASIQDVEAQDILDAIQTLKFDKKLIIKTHPPGQGPKLFLNWAEDELNEAKNTNDKSLKYRKYYNASIFAKSAIECLVDWYLSKFLLHLTIPPMAGVAQKLTALNSEDLLGINFSLFNDIVFEPRNRGIHKFELVEEKEARHSYELAVLTVKNCVNTVSPSEAPIYYGNLEISRGTEALSKLEKIENLDKSKISNPDVETFVFSGIGPKGQFGVFIERNNPEGQIRLFESIENGIVETRQCNIKNKFSPEQLRDLFLILESSKPKTITLKNTSELEEILNSFSEYKKPQGTMKVTLTQKIS